MSLVRVRRVALYLLLAGALYAVVAFPARSGDFVRLAFEAVSSAAGGLGDLVGGWFG